MLWLVLVIMAAIGEGTRLAEEKKQRNAQTEQIETTQKELKKLRNQPFYFFKN